MILRIVKDLLVRTTVDRESTHEVISQLEPDHAQESLVSVTRYNTHGVQVIRIHEGVLDTIMREQREGESISDTIGRLADHRSDAEKLHELVGLVPGDDRESFRERAATARANLAPTCIAVLRMICAMGTTKRRRTGTNAVLLDSTFLIDLVTEEPDAVTKIEELDNVRLRVSPVTVYEALLG